MTEGKSLVMPKEFILLTKGTDNKWGQILSGGLSYLEAQAIMDIYYIKMREENWMDQFVTPAQPPAEVSGEEEKKIDMQYQ